MGAICRIPVLFNKGTGNPVGFHPHRRGGKTLYFHIIDSLSGSPNRRRRDIRTIGERAGMSCQVAIVKLQASSLNLDQDEFLDSA